MSNLPGSIDEFERAIEGGVQQVKSTVGKTVSQTVSSTTKQIAPTDRDIVSSLYAPSEKEQPDQVDSGETSSPGEQIIPSFGELSGSLSGSPKEPGQRPTLASVREQLNAPEEIIGALTGAPQGEILPTESPVEQLVPTAGQVIGHLAGSVQTTRETPYTETFGEQIVPSFDNIANSIGIVPSEAPQSASAESQVQAISQQQANPQEMMMGDLDHSKQMSAQEKTTMTKEQKAERDKRWQFERVYRKFGTPLDDIGTLEEQVQKARQQREEEEKKRKEEEEQEEEEKKKKEEEEKQQLEEPTSKPAPGSPNIAIGQAQKKAEVHRGSSG